MSETNSNDSAGDGPAGARQDGTPHTPGQRVLAVLFKVSLVAFLVLGAALVLSQLVGVIVGSGTIVEGVSATLAVPMTVMAGIAGLLGFVMSYVFHWEVSD